METNIQVTYRHVPSEITEDFENFKNSNVTVTITNDKKEYFNFSGGPADILIYIDQHLTEIITTGLLAPVLYDGLKYSIKTAWKKLVQHYRQKNYKLQEDKNHIELNFKTKSDRTIEFTLNGSVDEKTVSDTVDKIFNYLKDKSQQDSDFQNRDYKDRFDSKPRIRMRYNPQTEKWEPVNFAELKKQLDELIRRAEEEFDS